MAKKQLKIPFKDGRPCKWVKDVHDEERDNYEFDECLEIHGFVRGCSSAVMILRPANDTEESRQLRDLYGKRIYIHRKGTRIGGMTYAILYLEVL